MLAPAIVYIVLLVGFPFLLSLYYSLSDATVASQEIHFVGLENFNRIVASPTFWTSLENTVQITVISQVLVIVFANVLAMALISDFCGKWLVRLLILLPWVAPISLSSIGWLWIFDSIYSIINWTARAVGLFGPHYWPIWLGEPHLAMTSIIIVQVWRMLPLATIIILAGFRRSHRTSTTPPRSTAPDSGFIFFKSHCRSSLRWASSLYSSELSSHSPI